MVLDFIKWYQQEPVEKTFEWKTDVVEYDNKNNQRNRVWSTPRRHWFLNFVFMEKRIRDRIIEIFNRAKGMYDSFLLKDEDDYSATSIFVGDGETKTFQLEKYYYPISDDFDEIGWTESKEDIKDGTVSVKFDEVSQPTGWSVGCTTGIITFDSAPGNGVAIEVSFEFYFRVIFAKDIYLDRKIWPRNVHYTSEILELIQV